MVEIDSSFSGKTVSVMIYGYFGQRRFWIGYDDIYVKDTTEMTNFK